MHFIPTDKDRYTNKKKFKDEKIGSSGVENVTKKEQREKRIGK